MTRLIKLLILILLTQSCVKKINDNEKLIYEIDLLNTSKTTYKIEVDSLGVILDTLFIQKKKEDKNKKLVHKETILFRKHDTLTSTSYYRENENLFYSKFESSALGVLSISEFFFKNNEIWKGEYIEYEEGIVRDTISISYEYTFNNGLKEKTIITSIYKSENEIGNITEIHYNKFGKLSSEISLQFGDTLKVTNYAYIKNVLNKKTTRDYNKNIIVNLDYDKNGYVSYEQIMLKKENSNKMVSKLAFKTNEKGDLISSVKTLLPSNKKIYIIYTYD